MTQVSGHNYTSNNSKLLKHLDKLQALQNGKPVSPVMVHLAITNKCNLDCSYCCYGGRDLAESLTTAQAKKVIESFSSIGTRGLEFTGGGDPLMHPGVNELVRYGKECGMTLGLISNGLGYRKFTEWDKLSWTRLSAHVLNDNNPKQIEVFRQALYAARDAGVDVGSVHIYHGNDDALKRTVEFMDLHRIPTRITPDLTKDNTTIAASMAHAKELVKDSQYCFISDFNFKPGRDAVNCWMRMVKPYVHADGFVYECPGASFSPENFRTVDKQYKVCAIDDIVETYTSPEIMKAKQYKCQTCKYDLQNMLINDVMRPTKHNDFA